MTMSLRKRPCGTERLQIYFAALKLLQSFAICYEFLENLKLFI